LILLNSFVALGVLGILVYTKILHKPQIYTEHTERAKLEQKIQAEPTPSKPELLLMNPVTAMIKPTRLGVYMPGAPEPKLQNHTVSFEMTIELEDGKYKDLIKEATPKVMDTLLKILGDYTLEELSTVQGRYILKTRIVALIHEATRKSKNDPLFVRNVYFSEFTIQ
jgi:uncharacterized protein (DUF2249 family)